MSSPQFTLSGGSSDTLSLSYYLAHGSSSSSADYLRVKVNGQTVLQELGAANNDDGVWATANVNLNVVRGTGRDDHRRGGRPVDGRLEEATPDAATLNDALVSG